MGVHHLWQLLAPAGRLSSLETLRLKKIAIDTSIWLVQFSSIIDERTGKPLPFSQLRGLFTRICKLLFFGAKPVFVFDGGVPVLKQRTMALLHPLRQRRQEALNERNVTKVAQRLLQQNLGEARYKELLGSKKSATSRKRKGRHHQGQEVNLKKGKHEGEGSSSQPTIDDPIGPAFSIIPVEQEESEDHLVWQEGRNQFLQLVDNTDELDEQDLEVLFNIGVDVDVYNSLPKDIQKEIISNAKKLEKRVPRNQAISSSPPLDECKPLSFLNHLDHSPEKFSERQMGALIKSGRFNRKMHQTVSHPLIQMEEDAFSEFFDGFPLNSELTAKSPVGKQLHLTPVANLFSSRPPSRQSTKLEGESGGSEGGFLADDECEEEIGQSKTWQDDRHFKETSENAGGFLMEDEDQSIRSQTTDKHNWGCVIEMLSDDELPVHNRGEKQNNTTFDFTLGSDRGDDDEEEDSLIPRRKRMARQQSVEAGSKAHLLQQGTRSSLTTSTEASGGVNDGDEETELHQVLELSLLQHQKDVEVSPWQGKSDDKKERLKGNRLEEDQFQRVLELSLAEEKERHRRDLASFEAAEREMVVIDDDENEAKIGVTENGEEEEIFIQVEMDECEPNPSASVPPSATVAESMTTTIAEQEKRRLEKGKEKLDEEMESIEGFGDDEQEWLSFVEEDSRVSDQETCQVDLSNEEGSPKEEATTQHDSEHTWDEVEREMEQEAIALSKKARTMHSIHSVSSLSQDVLSDCIALLQLFGLPYVVAPMEAEAQCSFLNLAGLVQGIITEDSDVFLFGGRTVYKNVFSRRRQVELHTIEDIKAHLGLDREKLISLALLLGSDYTEGVKGVGVATAMEIIGLFGSLDEFKAWWEQVEEADDPSDPHAEAKKRLRWLRTKVKLSPDFPGAAVVDAYRNPQIDESQERFEWGLPDLDGLRRFAKAKMGWSEEKVDELVLPILKRQAESSSAETTQTTITEFSSSTNRRLTPKLKSTRLQNAVLRMLGQEPIKSEPQRTPKRKSSRKPKQDARPRYGKGKPKAKETSELPEEEGGTETKK